MKYWLLFYVWFISCPMTVFTFQKFSQPQMRCSLCNEILMPCDALVNQQSSDQWYCLKCYRKIRGKRDEKKPLLHESLNIQTYGTFDVSVNDLFEEEDYRRYNEGRAFIENDTWQLTEQDVKRKKKKKKPKKEKVEIAVEIAEDQWPFVDLKFGPCRNFCKESLDKLKAIIRPGVLKESEEDKNYSFYKTFSKQDNTVLLEFNLAGRTLFKVNYAYSLFMLSRGSQVAIIYPHHLTINDIKRNKSLVVFLSPMGVIDALHEAGFREIESKSLIEGEEKCL